ncbi:MAG: ABC transporter permease [Bryobacteraceae bacterium]
MLGAPFFRENIGAALDTLRAHKVRSSLTVLGIVIGVTSVISVAAIIDGLSTHIKSRFLAMGSRVVFVSRIPFGTHPFRLPEKIRLRKHFQPDDVDFLRQNLPGVAYATTFTNRVMGGVDEIRYGGEVIQRLIVRGVDQDYARTIPVFSVDQGRFLSAFDVEHNRAVAVLGAGIASGLFGTVDPVGKQVRLNGRVYDVIGVFEPDTGIFGGMGVDQFVCIPFTNFRKNHPEVREIFFGVSFREDADLTVGNNDLIEALRRRRRVAHNADNDFDVIDPSFMSQMFDQVTGAMVMLTTAISSIGLLVGGIGVMNVMLISVTERTREIGVRKAVGARKADIRAQFLFEAMALSGTGGALGVALAAAAVYTLRLLVPSIPAGMSVFWIAAGVSVSVGVGLFFGYYPANRAANLDPIVCLRHE